jgi:hypothetical protein
MPPTPYKYQLHNSDKGGETIVREKMKKTKERERKKHPV